MKNCWNEKLQPCELVKYFSFYMAVLRFYDASFPDEFCFSFALVIMLGIYGAQYVGYFE